MDIGNLLSSINRFDLLVVLFCFGMFVLGYVQGTIRRVLGLASMLFAFLLAANLRDSFGGFLAENWNQFPDEYAVMLSFLIVFVTASVVFTIIIQSFYHKQDLFKKSTAADEVIGGLLGKQLFDYVWTKLDDEEPPEATTMEATWPKVLAAAAEKAGGFDSAKLTEALNQVSGSPGWTGSITLVAGSGNREPGTVVLLDTTAKGTFRVDPGWLEAVGASG